MKLGMNMLLWSTDVSGSEYDAVFGMVKDAGYDGVEIPIFDREVEKYAELGHRLGELGLERLAVSARGLDDNPIAAEAQVRAEAVAATKANLDPAAPPVPPLLSRPRGHQHDVFASAEPSV